MDLSNKEKDGNDPLVAASVIRTGLSQKNCQHEMKDSVPKGGPLQLAAYLTIVCHQLAGQQCTAKHEYQEYDDVVLCELGQPQYTLRIRAVLDAKDPAEE